MILKVESEFSEFYSFVIVLSEECFAINSKSLSSCKSVILFLRAIWAIKRSMVLSVKPFEISLDPSSAAS